MFKANQLVHTVKWVLGISLFLSSPAMANTWLDLDENENYVERHEMSFVQAGDRFYIFGGRESAQQLDTYNYELDSWTTSASAPLEFNHFQATEYQGFIWVIGAFADNRFPNEAPASHIYVFDPANDAWYQGPEIPVDRRRGSAGLVEYQDKFYVVGGNTIGHNGGYVDWFDVYDPKTGTWTVLDNAPNQRDHFAATIADDKLYVAGGRLSGGAGGTFAPLIAEVDVYDFATNQWSSLPASSNLPTPRAGTSTVTFGGRVTVIGGEGNGQAYDTVESLNPSTNLWTEMSPLNHARHGTQAIVSGDGIFTTGGSPNQGGGRQHNMEAFNSATPVGEAIITSTLEASVDELVIDSINTTQSIDIQTTSGNQGVWLTGVELTGDNASSFAITDNPTLPALIPANDSKTLFIRSLAGIEGEFTSLSLIYNNGQQFSVPVRFSNPNNPIESPKSLIVNGSFESVSIPNGRFNIVSSVEGWTANNNAEFWENGFKGVTSQDGDVYTELDVGRNNVDGLTQEINTTIGQRYSLSFYLRNRPNTNNSTNQVIVSWNGEGLGTFTPSNDWEQVTLEVVGTGFDRLFFGETNEANNGLGSHLDNVSLIAIDEEPERVELLVNGGFETALAPSENFSIVSSVEGWSLLSGQGEFWGDGFFNQPSQAGNVFTELDVGRSTEDGIEQTVSTNIGQTYTLSFYLKRRNGTTGASNGVHVFWNDVFVATFVPESNDWQNFQLELLGTGSDKLGFIETSQANDGRGSHIDSISLK